MAQQNVKNTFVFFLITYSSAIHPRLRFSAINF